MEAELAMLKQNNIELTFQNDQLKSELTDLKHNFSLHIYAALDSILQDKRAFYQPGTVIFKLKDGKFSKEISVDPRDLICVYTPVKGRKKAFVLREDVSTSSGKPREIYKLCELNNNELNYWRIRAKRSTDSALSRSTHSAAK